MQNTPYSMIFVSDFNAKCTNWHKHDERNFEVIVIKKISLQSGLCQAINKPTHILKNSLCCIGLMCTCQLKLITLPSVHSSLRLSLRSNLC